MIEWWQAAHVGTHKRVVLIQVDIGGHSKWLEEAYVRNHIEPYKQRAQLADQITSELAYRKYHKVFWAGDGGLFAAEPNEAGHPENLCDAVDDVFKVFKKWRADKEVELRVTATNLELTIDPDPGKWCSPRLNDFLKYERHLALPNAFVITGELRSSLVDNISLKRFPKSHRVPLPNGQETTCYIDTQHRHVVPKSSKNFDAWLRRRVQELNISVDKKTLRFGGCTVLDAAPRETGYGDIVFELQQPNPVEDVLCENDTIKWKDYRDRRTAKKQSGTSLRVARFVPELSDDPHPRLDCSTIPYVEARAFHELLEKDPSAVDRYREAALRVMGAGTQLPNILSTGIVVIVGSDQPELVIGNRRPRSGGYSGSCWSVSIGEQFKPLSERSLGRVVKADSSLAESVRRGVREELLGENFTGAINTSIQAFYLDDIFNSFAFVAIVDLRPLTFREIASMWHKAGDCAEHLAIASIPASAKVLQSCIASTSLPKELWLSACERNAAEFAVGVSSVNDDAHRWQPTSPIRLAAAWWYVEKTLRGT